MTSEVIGGRYRLERQLGGGAMGEVWLAHDLELERPVALKRLAPEADRARFEREARAAAALAHPNVTRLFDYGEADGRPYMALEYLPSGTLEERLPRGRALRDDEAAAIAAQLASGLAHAHAHGLVHRDLKPANILFDEDDRPKIADFGIARLGPESTLTEAGTVLGTAGYISPEQAAGESATPASDVYSFGVLLYRMLTGRLPFEAETPLELVAMHRRAEAPPIETLRPDAPTRLAAVATAALEKDPAKRPADGAALAAALDVDVPIAPTAAPTVVLRRRKRTRRPLLLIGVAAVLLVAGGVAAAVLITRGESGSPAPVIPRHRRVGSSAPASVAAVPSSTATTSTHATTPTTHPVTTVPATSGTTVTAPTSTIPTTTVPTTTTLPGPGG